MQNEQHFANESVLSLTIVAHKNPSFLRKWIYPILLITIYVIWAGYMTFTGKWALFNEFWHMSVTMAFGSFVAGATPLGGSVVAFPVFTKGFQVPATDARTFGLMIQSLGMTMASVMILVRRIRILPHIVGWTSLGATLGMVLGAYFLQMPGPYPRILFTFIMAVFGVALILSRWKLHMSPRPDIENWGNRHRFGFVAVGLLGGIFSANTGNGADMFTFIVLTLAYGVHEKISTPTTVLIMAINSIVGFLLYGAVFQNIGVVWNYWLVALPVVIVGAPLGAIAVSLVKREHLIVFLLGLILIELVTTLWLITFSATMVTVTVAAILVCGVWFGVMVRYHLRLTSQKISS